MLQINTRKHVKSTTVALRGVIDETDAAELTDQLDLILKYDNKLELVFDCTRLLSAASSTLDTMHNIFLRLSYLRKISFCGMNDEVKKAVKRSRTIEIIHIEDNYQDYIEEINGTLEEEAIPPEEIRPIR